MSRTIRELYELLGIKSIRTSVYHPQTDGLVERFNRTLKTMIRKFVHEDAKNWDKWLEPPFCSLCARSRKPPRGFPLRAPVRPPAPAGFGRPEGDLEEGPSESKNEIQHVLDLRQNSTLGAALHGEFVTGPGQAKPAIQSGGQITQFPRREIKCLCYSPPLAPNTRQVARTVRGHTQVGDLIMRWFERIGAGHVRFITSTSLKMERGRAGDAGDGDR